MSLFVFFTVEQKVDICTQIRKMKYQRPSAGFRAAYQYNNNWYTLISYLPTMLLPSKIPYAQYVKQHIFEPLGLNSTTFSLDVANATGRLAEGIVRQTLTTNNPAGIVRTVSIPLAKGEDGYSEFLNGDSQIWVYLQTGCPLTYFARCNSFVWRGWYTQ
jgi:CubicO group peptidase (beta-lactamase class C family)